MSKYNLYIVDDEEDIRNSLKRNLKKLSGKSNIAIKTAASADEALEMLNREHEKTALIISDQKMPGRAGSDFLKEVATLYPDIVTIMLTGHAGTSDIGDFIEAGIYSFLEKPWDNVKLITDVENGIELYKLRRKTAEQEKLLRAELNIASEFQKLFLKVTNPSNAFFKFDIAHQNARNLSFGGDYYDCIEIDADKYLLLLGDVAGHGLKASFLVAILKSIIYSEFVKGTWDNKFSPAALLTWLNGRMHTILHHTPDLFLAFSACCIDAHTKTLTCANGGQPPPLLITEKGVIETCQPQPALGVAQDLTYNESSFSVSPGDVAFLCTDGLYPAGKKVNHIDRTLFRELLREMREGQKSAESIINTVMMSEKALLEEDDVTIISARVLQ